MDEFDYAAKTDIELAYFMNLALLMCHGISEQDVGFDHITSINDVGLAKMAVIIGKIRDATKRKALE